MTTAVQYRRALGTAAAFLVVGLLVKYSELLFTFEHRQLIEPQGTVASRAAQVWLSLRFSWQELTLAAGLVGLLLLARGLRPAPGRVMRAAIGTIQVVMALMSLVSVFGIAYYALYQTHFTLDDLEYLAWAPQVAGTAGLFEHLSVRICASVWLVATFGFPWVVVRLPERVVRTMLPTVLTGLTLLAGGAYLAGRPNLAEARLEPNPVLWALFGQRVSYANLPPVEAMAPVGPARRRYTPSERPTNVILVVLESTPAQALALYNPDAEGGRRLAAEFGGEITAFDDVFATQPNSSASFFSVMTGIAPVPTAIAALAARGSAPTLAELLEPRQFYSEMLLNGPTDAIFDSVGVRGFRRSLHMHSRWPRQDEYAHITWGYDDRMLFDEALDVMARKAGDGPFFLLLHANNPHAPYASEMIPGLGGSRDQKERHRRLVNHLMDRLTDLYASMRRRGLADNTVVIAYGDHGEAFGEHQGNFIHSKELYWENLHVPVLLLHPRRLGLPPRIKQLGALEDIWATTLDVLGIEVEPRSGMSLLFEAPDRVTFSLTDWGPGQVAFRTAQYLYVLSRTGRELLFDRIADPRETRNLVTDRPEIAAMFRARLAGREQPR